MAHIAHVGESDPSWYPACMLALAPCGSKLQRQSRRWTWAPGRPHRLVEVMALYVTGLILLEKGQTAVRIATVLPGRAHDALNRLLRVLPWSLQHLILGLIRWRQRQTGSGYLCLDDVVVEKPFAKLLTWVGWTYSHSKQGHVFGFHVVSHEGACQTPRLPPVSFRSTCCSLIRAKTEPGQSPIGARHGTRHTL